VARAVCGSIREGARQGCRSSAAGDDCCALRRGAWARAGARRDCADRARDGQPGGDQLHQRKEVCGPDTWTTDTHTHAVAQPHKLNAHTCARTHTPEYTRSDTDPAAVAYLVVWMCYCMWCVTAPYHCLCVFVGVWAFSCVWIFVTPWVGYVCVSVCVSVCVRACICACVHVCVMCIRVLMYMCARVYVHLIVYVLCVCWCMLACSVRMCVCAVVLSVCSCV
jgi:hypothetical protein